MRTTTKSTETELNLAFNKSSSKATIVSRTTSMIIAKCHWSVWRPCETHITVKMGIVRAPIQDSLVEPFVPGVWLAPRIPKRGKRTVCIKSPQGPWRTPSFFSPSRLPRQRAFHRYTTPWYSKSSESGKPSKSGCGAILRTKRSDEPL